MGLIKRELNTISSVAKISKISVLRTNIDDGDLRLIFRYPLEELLISSPNIKGNAFGMFPTSEAAKNLDVLGLWYGKKCKGYLPEFVFRDDKGNPHGHWCYVQQIFYDDIKDMTIYAGQDLIESYRDWLQFRLHQLKVPLNKFERSIKHKPKEGEDQKAVMRQSVWFPKEPFRYETK